MTSVVVGERAVEVSRPDKVLFPEDGFTKADLVGYYARVAERMLPHVLGRAVAMHRFPDGIGAPGFLHKQAPDHFPDFVARASLAREDGATDYVVVDNPETIVYLAEQACITPHVWLSRVDRPHHPDRLVFDLDPGASGLDPLRRTAGRLRQVLTALDLPAFVKSTGSSGAHVEVPLDRGADFDTVRAFARSLAARLADADPEAVTVAQRKEQREGRLFVDVNRNGYAQHAVAPYAVRALPGAPVAVPLDWGEVLSAGFDPRRYTVGNLFRRLGQKQDPWAGLGEAVGDVRAAAARLEEATGLP